MEDGNSGLARRLEHRDRVLRRALDQLGAAEDEVRVGERVLQVDREDGRSLSRLDTRLAVTALHPGIAGIEVH